MNPAAIILTTYHAHEPIVDACVNVLQTMWPEHPPIIVFSDKGEFDYERKVIVDSSHWVEVVAQGTQQAIQKQYFQDNDYVLLLLEDHIPLSPPPFKHLKIALEHAAEKDWNYLALFGHGKGQEVHQAGDLSFYERVADYKFYSEVHPAFWKASYLLNLAQYSIEHQQLSAWDFERQRGLSKHYTTNLQWTSELGGFLNGGSVDGKRLQSMNSPELKQLKRQLQTKAIKALPKRAFKRLFK